MREREKEEREKSVQQAFGGLRYDVGCGDVYEDDAAHYT